jgi:hypothetical protein
MIDTLWDESIINGVDTKETPKMLLKKQASDLAVITKQVVQANITTEMEHDGFLHCFDIIAPVLNYSTNTAFCVKQPLNADFPLIIYTGIGILDVNDKCDDLDDFKVHLSNIFKSKEMVAMVQSIIKQSI